MRQRRQNHDRLFALVLCVEAILLALTVHLMPALPHMDDPLYLIFGQGIAGGHGLINQAGHPTAIVTPGYPILIAIFLRLFGRDAVGAVHITQAVLLAVTAWLAQDALGSLGASRRARLLAQIGIAAYPPFVIFAAHVMTETLSSFFIIALFWVLGRALLTNHEDRRPSFATLLSLAFVAGVAVIAVRPTGLLFSMALSAAVLLGLPRRDPTWKRMGLVLAVIAAGNLAFIGAWGARNQRELGAFVPLSTEGAYVAYSGNCLAADGMGTFPTFRRIVGDEEYARVMSLPEVEQSRYFSRLFQEELRTHARELPGLWGRKLIRLWLNLAFPDPPSRGSLVMSVANAILLLLGAWGSRRLWSAASKEARSWLVTAGIFLLALTAAHVVTLSFIRYAFPGLILAIMLAAVSVDSMLGARRGPAAAGTA